jgi:hypothetical protein
LRLLLLLLRPQLVLSELQVWQQQLLKPQLLHQCEHLLLKPSRLLQAAAAALPPAAVAA